VSSSPARKTLKRARKVARNIRKLREAGTSAEALSEYRRRVTREDPALFALIYLSRHLVDKATDEVGLADVHVAWARAAKSWMVRSSEPMADRRAEVAPREMGKSTWWFLLLPMWAAAHRHVGFAAAFADSDTQAQTHLATFKSELDNNALIRADYPDLVAPKTRGRGQVEADRVSLYHARSGFVFAAAGADSRNLGLKVGDQRPDLLIIDDIEPHEGQYSADLAKRRLDTLVSAILPLNIYAHVIIAGTVTMGGSIIHQIVQYGRGERSELNEWVGEQRITARHTLPIVTDEDGRRRSVWPAKWPLTWLESIEHTRQYAKNYANDPLGAEGDYWQLEDVERARTLGVAWLPSCTRILVSVDPAVTKKKTSDYTGIAVIAWQPPPRDKPRAPGRVIVLEVRQVKKSGAALRLDVIDTITRWNAGLVYVETNQGGDLWQGVFWGMPVKVKQVQQHEPKEERAARWLDHYQRNRVAHNAGDEMPLGMQRENPRKGTLADYEAQLVAFPNAPHDDMVDAAGTGGLYFLDRERRNKRVPVGGETSGYAA
jgi:hypothetical protein